MTLAKDFSLTIWVKPVVGGAHLSFTNKTKPYSEDENLYLRICLRYSLVHFLSGPYACATSIWQYAFEEDTVNGGALCHKAFFPMKKNVSGLNPHVDSILFTFLFSLLSLDRGSVTRLRICDDRQPKMHFYLDAWHAGHDVAHSKGGSNLPENKAPIHPACNSDQRTKTFSQYKNGE